jgi:predicted transcriptional regulator
MSMTIDLPPEVEDRLRHLAEERGLAPQDYLRTLVEEALRKERGTHVAEMLAAWDDEDRTVDPAELASRREDWEALQRAMNESHPSDRIPFP